MKVKFELRRTKTCSSIVDTVVFERKIMLIILPFNKVKGKIHIIKYTCLYLFSKWKVRQLQGQCSVYAKETDRKL